MEIPLRMRTLKTGALVYGIPFWYRVVSGGLLAVVIAAVATAGEVPGIIAWIVLALLSLGFLYEERWLVDPGAKLVTHRAGLLVAARATRIAFDDITGLGLSALARGTTPGSDSERTQARRAFDQMRGHDHGANPLARNAILQDRLGMNRNMMCLVLHRNDGETYLVDTLPARRASRLKTVGEMLAGAIGVSFTEECPD